MKVSQKVGFIEFLKDKNFLAAIIAIIFSFSMIVTTKSTSSPYPYVIFGLCLALGVLLLAQTLIRKNTSSVEMLTWKELLFMAILIINPLCAKLIGFYVSAFIEVFVISIFISSDKHWKTIGKLLLYSFLIVAFSYVLFTFGLRIRCPKGALSLF